MTTKYECDRCHRQYDDEKEMAVMDTTQHLNGMKIERRYHFCTFCRVIAFNSLDMAVNGKYGGSLRETDMIGYFPDKSADPLFSKEGER